MDEKQIKELLECSVCLELLDGTCKVLPCQHTFCRRCLEEILQTSHELCCPECRAPVTIPISELPTNILVVRILEGMKPSNQRQRVSSNGGNRQQGLPVGSSSSPSKFGRSSPSRLGDGRGLLRQVNNTDFYFFCLSTALNKTRFLRSTYWVMCGTCTLYVSAYVSDRTTALMNKQRIDSNRCQP